ncbi:MAG: TetR/AcrR family transcriptional regulator [Candidatus Odinarchaeota archaeon]
MTSEKSDPEVQVKYDREGKIQKILETTINLVINYDFERVTIRQIAKEAGVSVGTVYLYFPAGKEDIVKNMVSYVRLSLQSDGYSTSMKNLDLNSAVHEWLGRSLAFHQENRAILLAFEKASLKRPGLFQDVNLAIETEALKDSREWERLPEIQEAMQKLNRNMDEMRNAVMQAGRIIDALVHRHVLFSKLYRDDAQLIEVLTRIFRELVLK